MLYTHPTVQIWTTHSFTRRIATVNVHGLAQSVRTSKAPYPTLRMQESVDPSSQSTQWKRSYYCYRRNYLQVYTPFPPGTHSFFYYRAPPPWAHDLAGEIRFRITKDSDPSSFAGEHHLLVQGMPWIVTLLFNTPYSAAFHSVLLRDGLLSEDQIRRLGRLEPWRSTLTARARLIHSIGQPFALPVSTNRNTYRYARYFVPSIVDSKDVLEKYDLMSSRGSQWGYNTGQDEARVFSKDDAYVVSLSDQSKRARVVCANMPV
ncbi:uncharacterized protein PHACADRAFT_179643 [Phanerochaete carnosa HHB-10118-sp]|uniref:Uncharacterized protein n=1 Tax=Phanerochaete carnosa (strain HHB-10118-sp) TaxID=650164 RepID=K5WM63_PHACS|nr:uncharacterized protein PHACADRAFT_179643 [Phanerochaete carnosa HHB-10118-sp]EKM60274.1 hypothetical protein PHACADRAFT_179643 [Phanerochaete carnosa HHB-10118-sp]